MISANALQFSAALYVLPVPAGTVMEAIVPLVNVVLVIVGGVDASTVTDVTLLKALLPMLVTLDGIVTLVSPVHPENAELPMLVTPSGIVTLVSLVHPENVSPEISVTELGRIKSPASKLPEKADSPI